MSAAKMVADSTQADVPELSGTKKRKKMVQKKKVKKKKETSKKSKKKSQLEDEFDDSDLDLDKDVYPISCYVKDRESLLEQMLHCVRGQSFNRALPEVLKELPLEDLKRRCMEQLEVMSKKRIRRILAGDDPASISSSGTEDETSEEEAQDVEEGEYESLDSQVVDSTSYTLETAVSDREVEYEEGSVGQSSTYLSDEEPDNQQQYEEDEDADGSDEDVNMEVETHSDNEAKGSPAEPEEPEEGEVFDDNSNESALNSGISDSAEKKSDVVNDVELSVIEASNKTIHGESNENAKGESAELVNVETKVDAEDSKDSLESEGTEQVTDDKKDAKGNTDDASDITKSDDKSKEISVSVDCDTETSIGDTETSIVETENTEEDEKQEHVKGDVAETEGNEDHVITVEADHEIDEQAANIGADVGGEELSDDGEIVEKGTALKTEEKPLTELQKEKQPRRIVKPPKQDIAPALTRNQMELLELEMRARAIKAMLKTAK